MRRSVVFIGLLALALAAMTSCGSDEPVDSGDASTTTNASTTRDGGTAGGLDAVVDHVYLSTALEGRKLAAGSTISLTFDDSRLIVNAGCNTISGDVKITDSSLRWTGQPMSTQMGCDPALMDQDTWITGWLTDGVDATLEGDTLTLTDGTVTLTLVDKKSAQPDQPLVGTDWTLDTTVTNEAASSLPAGVKAPTLTIDEDGTAAVFTGCNRGTSKTTVSPDGTSVTFDGLAMTKMMCPDDGGRSVEAAVIAVLDGEVQVVIDGSQLTLMKGSSALRYTAS